MKQTFTSLTIGAVTLLFTGIANAVPVMDIDLNDFTGNPSVSISADGTFALLAESSTLTPRVLQNNPGLGDPEVITAGAGVSLIFDFMFQEGVGNDDIFNAFVIDAATGTGVSPGFVFSTSTSSSGSVAFDLSGLTAFTLGLRFELESNDNRFGSFVNVSNVRLVSANVPEPSIILLLGSGLALFGLIRRKIT